MLAPSPNAHNNWGWAKNQERAVGLPWGGRDPSAGAISDCRKLEIGVEPGPGPRHPSMGSRCPSTTLATASSALPCRNILKTPLYVVVTYEAIKTQLPEV